MNSELNKMPSNANSGLPDVSRWQPRTQNSDTLRRALEITCQLAQDRITARSKAEARFNIDNYDVGPGVEDIVREELSTLLPERYSVAAGVVNDRNGKTAGDCDLIIRDKTWSPAIKLGATIDSRRFHFPVEGVYAAVEIKRSLGTTELDGAMEKLVRISRLERPPNPYGHITENQHIQDFDRPEHILNPLHTVVFATGLKDGNTFAEIAQRFGDINSMLNRDEMVQTLCVLDHGTAWYSDVSGNSYDATYMWDRHRPLVMQLNAGEPTNAFYRFYVLMLGHLTRSVLGLTGIGDKYGNPPPERAVFSFENAVFNRDTE